MQNDQPANPMSPPNPAEVIAPTSQQITGRKVIQPSAALVQEQQLLAQQPAPAHPFMNSPAATTAMAAPAPQQPTVVSAAPPLPGDHVVMPMATPSPLLPPAPPSPQNVVQPGSMASLYPQPTHGMASVDMAPPPQPAGPQSLAGLSGNKIGWGQPKDKVLPFSGKKAVIGAVVGLAVLGVAVAVLSFTNILPLNRFKTVSFTDRNGSHYRLAFYAKHKNTTLKDGTPALESKVSAGGKFPILVVISATNEAGYSRLSACTGMRKVLDVQNSPLKQTIAVCNLGTTNQRLPDVVYVAGIKQGDRASVITISQDYSSINVSSASNAQQSIDKFGLEPYQDDIESMLATVSYE